MNQVIDLNAIHRFRLNDVARGLIETSPEVCGNWRTSWVMQLRRKQGSTRLPRGFRGKVSKPSTEYV